jgi:Caspase domain
LKVAAMANWAIVIGIDKYWTPSACLSGAVRDALRMREWLLEADGGGVPPANHLLLLSPKGPDEIPDGIEYDPGTHDTIITHINRLLKESGGEGDRLFFHYSGHGLSNRQFFRHEDALVPEDFTDEFTDRSLGLWSILDCFKATRFREQFFFIDACRNIPWEGEEFTIGGLSRLKRPDCLRPAVQQFVFYATSPGVRAAETGLAGDEQGAFTHALLGGLRGAGRAKVWDWTNEEYIVRVDRLLNYLVTEMEKKRIAVCGAGGARAFQVPRLGGEYGAPGGSNPVLARFPAAAFDDESLEVLIDPFIAESQAAVWAQRESTTVAHQTGITQVPVMFTLRPMEYVIRANALAFEQKDKCVVELYEAEQLTIKLALKPGALTEEEQAVWSAVTATKLPRQAQEELAVDKGVRRETVPRDLRDRRPDKWQQVLESAVGDGKSFLQRYGEFMNSTDRSKLLDLIWRGERALSDLNPVEGSLAATRLRGKVLDSGAASTLFMADWLMEMVPADTKKWVAQEADEVRAAFAAGDTAGVERYSGEIWQISQILTWCLLQVTQFMWSLYSWLMPWSGFSWKELAHSSVLLMSDDPLAPLELVSSTGEVLHVGSGRLPCPELEPGFYRARLLSPEGQMTERLIEFSGGTEAVSLSAPRLSQTTVMKEMIRRGKFTVRRDNTLRVQKTMSPIATAQVSTLLLLAGNAALHGGLQANGTRLANLGVSSFNRVAGEGAECGVQTLFGVESDALGSPCEYGLRLWQQDAPVPESADQPAKISRVEGLAEFARAVQPGDYWLAVGLRQQRPVVFALKTLPGRLATVIFHINAKGGARVFQYSLPLSLSTPFKPDTLRRLELVQRFYLSGRLDHAYEMAKGLPELGEGDPLAGCLAGYLLLSMGRAEEAGRVARQVMESFEGLSDGFVLNAECEASKGRPKAAADAYLAALERGTPVFSDGLVRLCGNAQRYRIKHPGAGLLANMLKSLARGMIWSAWSPESFTPGRLLSPTFTPGAGA